MHDWAVRQGLVEPDFYKIISAHQGSPGNEHLRPRDIVQLHRFAKFLQNNLINRRGILKNATRGDLLYRTARRAGDIATHAIAAVALWVGRQYFTRTITELPPAPKVPGEGGRPLVFQRSSSVPSSGTT